MANIQAAVKSIRQTERRTIVNNRIRRRLKNAVKKFNGLVEAGEKEEAATAFVYVTKMLDKAAKKNVIKKGTASRRKSRFAKKLNNLSAPNVQTA